MTHAMSRLATAQKKRAVLRRVPQSQQLPLQGSAKSMEHNPNFLTSRGCQVEGHKLPRFCHESVDFISELLRTIAYVKSGVHASE